MAEINDSFGHWRAHVVIEGKTPQLHIHGSIKTNAEKPIFSLTKSVPQGFNPLILLLDSNLKELIDPKGKYSQSIFQSFAISSPNEHNAIQIKDIASFAVSTNIGTWTARVKKGNKTSFLVVNGNFPTNGEEPVYSLQEAELQGIVHKQLILLLNFGTLADQEGKVNQKVKFTSDILLKEDEYTSIMVIDENGRIIATQLIKFI